MRSFCIILFTLPFVCIALLTQAQQKAPESQPSVEQEMKQPSSKNLRFQNVFVELGGQGLFLTANYDTRFSQQRNGLGARIGIGVGPSLDYGIFTKEGDAEPTPILFPFSFNYLVGNGEKHFLEVGLGATLATGDIIESAGTMSLSYRFRSGDKGVGFRAGFTPTYTVNGLSGWGGLSFGVYL